MVQEKTVPPAGASDQLEPDQRDLKSGRDGNRALQSLAPGEDLMRSMRLAAWTVAMTLAFGGLALARDHDDHSKNDYYKDNDSKHDRYPDKYQDRHRDRDHQWENRDHDRNWDHDRNNDRWREGARERERERWEREQRNDGYRGGPVYNRYPRGYPGGGYGYPGSVYGRGGYGNDGAGFNQGLQDGSNQARKDVAQGKPFNPYPRGGNHSDRGYHSDMGDKNTYRADYEQGYRSGYQSNFGGRRRGWGF